jgi:hypothetical protein
VCLWCFKVPRRYGSESEWFQRKSPDDLKTKKSPRIPSDCRGKIKKIVESKLTSNTFLCLREANNFLPKPNAPAGSAFLLPSTVVLQFFGVGGTGVVELPGVGVANEQSTGGGLQEPSEWQALNSRLSKQLGSPGGHRLHVWPHVLPAQGW